MRKYLLLGVLILGIIYVLTCTVCARRYEYFETHGSDKPDDSHPIPELPQIPPSEHAEHSGQPVEQSVDPVDQPVDQSVDQSVEHTVVQSVDPVEQSVEQSVDQSVEPVERPVGHTNKCTMSPKCDTGKCTQSLYPILDPHFNMRESAKQCLLLEDHLNNSKKRCDDCIRKHFLMVDALLEEAVSLEQNNQQREMYRGLYQQWVGLEKLYALNPTDMDEISKKIRLFRKPLVEQYFDTVSEYE